MRGGRGGKGGRGGDGRGGWEGRRWEGRGGKGWKGKVGVEEREQGGEDMGRVEVHSCSPFNFQSSSPALGL